MPRGSIRRKPTRGDDAWEVQASAGSDPLDRTKRRRLTRLVHGTRADAEKALTALLAEIDAKPQATEGTVAHLLEEWWQIGNAGRWSPKTADGYRQIIDRRLLPDLGTVRLRDLTLEQLERYYVTLRTRHRMAERTIRNHHAVLRAALGLAAKWKWIPANPAAGAEVPRDAEPVEIDPPSPMQMRLLIDHLVEKHPQLATLIRLAGDTGMRRGEMCGLRWSAIDLERGELDVRRSIVQVGGEIHDRGTTKTRQKRTIDLSGDTVAWLRRHREAREAFARDNGRSLSRDAFVFSYEPDGSVPWRPDTVTQAFRRARAKALGKDDRTRLHDVRHFMASQWLEAGVDVVTVSQRLGHAKTSTTVDVYGHGSRERQRKAAEEMGRLLG